VSRPSWRQPRHKKGGRVQSIARDRLARDPDRCGTVNPCVGWTERPFLPFAPEIGVTDAWHSTRMSKVWAANGSRSHRTNRPARLRFANLQVRPLLRRTHRDNTVQVREYVARGSIDGSMSRQLRPLRSGNGRPVRARVFAALPSRGAQASLS